ncbi:MAG TPA: putative DNA-binding domain-containing protein [Steroidobacteraceae bacterium]|nr:putative DNA-binding domain-containing protein [Steroidobacteraceae bacterium]
MSLADQQRAFAAHLRDPQHAPAPDDVEPRRMAVYRELFFNNLVDLLGGAFPVLRRILGDAGWRSLVREFYARHHAHTPYFLELPREFLEWLQARGAPGGGEPAFLAELAHYEWVELALAISEAQAPPSAALPADALDAALAVSPLAWPLAYRWPVHRLGPDHRPEAPPAQPTFLVVYRDGSDRVQFLEIGAETARLLDALERSPALSARAACAGQGLPLTNDAARAAADSIRELHARGVLVAVA